MENKVVLVTGCSRGIGKAISKKLASKGAVVYANSRTEGSIEEASGITGEIVPVYFDVRDKNACKEAVMKIKKERGRIDALVNNAGIMKDAYLGMIDEKIINEIFDTNVFAVINLTQLVVRIMKKQNAGSIVNMSSIVGIRGNAGQTVYSASKGAVAALTKTWAKELAEYNIRVNAIAPGKIDTDMFRSIGDDRVNESISEIGLGRLGSAEEVAEAAAFFVSEESRYITGEILGVNGGLFI